MERRICITVNDYQRLTGLVEFTALKIKNPSIADSLLNELKLARMLPQESISGRVVTMNSRVLLKELSAGRETEVTIAYPQDADHRHRRVSILSPIGIALLGRQEGDVASWRVPSGVGQFRIEKVIYQPEAAGHYYL